MFVKFFLLCFLSTVRIVCSDEFDCQVEQDSKTVEEKFMAFSEDIKQNTGVDIAKLLDGLVRIDEDYRLNGSNGIVVNDIALLLHNCGVVSLNENLYLNDNSDKIKDYFKYLMSICSSKNSQSNKLFDISKNNKVAVTNIKKEDVADIALFGDVHGSIVWARAVSAFIKNYKHGRAIIFAGDILDRDYEYNGLGSLANLILFSGLNVFAQRYSIPIVCVRGNHDSVASMLRPQLNHWIVDLVFKGDRKKMRRDEKFSTLMKKAIQSIFPIQHVLKIKDQDKSYSVITNHGFGAEVFKNKIKTDNRIGKTTVFYDIDIFTRKEDLYSFLHSSNENASKHIALLKYTLDSMDYYYGMDKTSDDLFSSWTDPVHVKSIDDLSAFRGRVPFPVSIMGYFIYNNFDFAELNDKWIMHVGHSHSKENVPNIIQGNAKGKICVVLRLKKKKVTHFPGVHSEDFIKSGCQLEEVVKNNVGIFSPPMVYGNRFGNVMSKYGINSSSRNFIYSIILDEKKYLKLVEKKI
jgi:hypothetical protein